MLPVKSEYAILLYRSNYTKAMVEDTTDLEGMKTDVQTLLIAAEVNETAGDVAQTDSSLRHAHELQKTILARSR